MNGNNGPDRVKTAEDLYDMYMNTGEYAQDNQGFKQDIYYYFGGENTGMGLDEWVDSYGLYVPDFDPAGMEFAKSKRDIRQQQQARSLEMHKDVTKKSYQDTLRSQASGTRKQINDLRNVAGRLGLSSGALQRAGQDAIVSATNEVESLEDRFDLASDAIKNDYNKKIVDSTLDYEKTVLDEKEDYYNDVMKSLSKLAQIGALARPDTAADEAPVQWDDPEQTLEHTVIPPVTDTSHCLTQAGLCGTWCVLELWGGTCYNDCMNRHGCPQ